MNKGHSANNEKLLHLCEVCGRTEWLTPEEAHEQGWDYPPMIGSFGILSPRTCGNCAINETLWWRVMQDNTYLNRMTDHDKEVLERILHEPEILMEKQDDT